MALSASAHGSQVLRFMLSLRLQGLFLSCCSQAQPMGLEVPHFGACALVQENE